MKASEVAWLGAIPEDWALERMKVVLRERNERNRPDAPLLAATQSKGVIRKDRYENRTVVAQQALETLKFVHRADFVISLRSFEGGIEYAHDEGIISPAYTVLAASSGASAYLAWLFKSAPFVDGLKLFITGIREGQNIDYERLSRSSIPLPPSDEREAIVRFLDHADRRIRRYIRAKQKLIGLLEEQKQVIIHRAVTRGLDPDVRLKPSGVEWLGDVPEHWKVGALGSICTYISYGFTNPMPSTDDGPFMLTANDVGNGQIRYSTARHTSQHAFEHLLTSKSRPLPGDLLVTKDGTLGRIAIADGTPVCINQSIALLRLSEAVDPAFASLLLRSPLYQERMKLDAGGTTIKHIYITRLAKMAVGLPPRPEQLSIIKSVSTALRALDRKIRASTEEISLLREYRTRLIADVVTGKLDVREAAAHLPQQTPELDEPEFFAREVDDDSTASSTGDESADDSF